MNINEKMDKLTTWFKGQSIEFRELKHTVPDTKKYNKIVDEIQQLCCDIQEKYGELLM